MAWLKSLHIITLSIWCAGLLYMPGLLALHAHTHDPAAFHRLRVMSRYTFVVLISPAAVIAIISGTALVYPSGASGLWLAGKLSVVTMMVMFHLYCGHMLAELRPGAEPRRRFRGWLVVLPALFIPIVLWLVMAKPSLATLLGRYA